MLNNSDDDFMEFHLLFDLTDVVPRRERWKQTRIDWNRHLEMLRHTRGFQSRYHMSEPSFNKLVGILRSDISVDANQSMRSSSGNGPITAEMIVGAGLRFLGGELHKSIADMYKINVRSVIRIVDKFLVAVEQNSELAIKIPTTTEDLKKSADDWDKLSGAFGIYYGVVGAIDGWLACIEKPTISNATDYYSGHYQCFGLNIQAVCDSNLRFIYFSVAAPGRTNDSRVFGRCLKLRKWLDNLPPEYFVVGDNAYTLTDNLLIPFSGSSKSSLYNSVYNFYLSQLRIRIEMAFGRLTTKWRIFRKNLNCSMEKNARICNAAARLHNFVIDNDNIAFTSRECRLEDFGVEALVSGPADNNGFLPAILTNEQQERSTGTRRVDIVSEIKTRDMRRPLHNRIRNGEIDSD